jgi:hypothetical protein
VPRTPAYLRAKVLRHLARVGAVAVKNSVYVLPLNDDTREDFQWIAREIRAAGADASVFEAAVVDGLRDADLEARFREALRPQWEDLATDADAALKTLRRVKRGEDAPDAGDIARLRKRADELAAIDFFGAPGGREASAKVAECERRVRGEAPMPALEAVDPRSLVGRTWVTRRGVHVDRIATAWLVRRFLDPDARFVFVARSEGTPEADALRFDMFGGEFTHEGDLCTFEVLAIRAGVAEPAVRALGEVIHDLDLKDGKFGRPETVGVGAAVAGLCWAHSGDEERLRAGGALFDALHEYFRRKGDEREAKP